MPELKHEIPSDDELFEYFRHYLNGSPFIGLHPDAPIPAEYCAQHEADGTLAVRLVGGDVFAAKAADAILDAHHRLNHLPRSDPFWHDTNKRPTLFKLPSFCRGLVEADPKDKRALWSLASLSTFQYLNDFGQVYWQKLYRLGGLDMAMPTFAALLTGLTAKQSSAQYAAFVHEIGESRAADTILGRITECDHARIQKWVRRSRRALRLFEARANSCVHRSARSRLT